MVMLVYFAYGSNLHPLRLRQRVPSSRTLTAATLTGYRLLFHKRGRDGSGKCNVHYTGHNVDQVTGVLYHMAVSEKSLLDAAEGVGRGYNVRELTVSAADGADYRAFSYIADPDHIDDGLTPFTWYKQLVVEGARHHQLPHSYVESLEQIESSFDPDPVRSDLHLAILR